MTVRESCVTLMPTALSDEDSILLYAAHHFEVYSDTY